MILKTSSDNLHEIEDINEFIFNIDDIDSSIKALIELGKCNEIERIKSSSLKSMFDDIFSKISNKIILDKYNKNTEKLLLDNLKWLVLEIENARVNEDPFIYQRFINRIFDLNNSSIIFTENNEMKSNILNTIANIIYTLSIYTDNVLDLKKNINLFINSCLKGDEKIYMMFYNGKNQKQVSQAKQDVIFSLEVNEYFSKTRNYVQCILIDVDEVDFFEEFESITIIPKNKERINSKMKKINFIKSDEIIKIFNGIKYKEINIVDNKNKVMTLWEAKMEV
ncbi:hypothetical protein [Clostridium gasigenes]|uniref:Uncharacterized protein n=1 Tax=Clostridium gasigenes TaxID=94869 RepID=A0A1H0LTW6_9CLOT|nr:hypothetical protein [Clostridium gasigenes]SDO71340.1 hypothetical protein SAMN04488529_101193 [Clostridium gasigenes]